MLLWLAANCDLSGLFTHGNLNQSFLSSSVKFRARRVAHFRADHHAIVFTCELGDASIERLIVGLGVSHEDWQEFGLVVNLRLAS